MTGIFYQPRPLGNLSDVGLLAYRDECAGILEKIKENFNRLDGRLTELNRGFATDGILVTGGVVIAGVGIAVTAVFTMGGVIALAGGAVSLMGARPSSS